MIIQQAAPMLIWPCSAGCTVERKPLDIWYTEQMIIEFEGKLIYWRGPAPYVFVAVPEDESDDIKAVSALVTYGWGVIPVHVRIGKTEWETSLFPKNGRYLVPIRVSVQRSEDLEVDDTVLVQLEVRLRPAN